MPHKNCVSVIIPTFNRGWAICDALKSVLDQTTPPHEVIVIDDGSTDNTKDALEPFKDRIKLFTQKNSGVSAARNLGIKKSSGDFLAFLDSDDLWLPEKLSCQLDFFNTHLEAMICQTEEIWIRNGRRVNPKIKHKKPSGMIFEKSLHLCLVSPSAVMMRRIFFDIKGYFDEALPACEDYDLWLRTAIDMPIFLVDIPCIIKNGGHEDQLSANHSLDRYRIQSLANLIKNHPLNPEQKKAAICVLKKKCEIYGMGCIKRGKAQEGNHFLSMGLKVADMEKGQK